MKKIRNAVELSVMCATLVLSLMLCSFELNRQASSNELRVRNFYREKRLDRETLSLMRSRIDTVIQQFWPAETTGPIARTPFDFAFEQLDRSAIADRVRRPRRAANSATAKRQRAA